MDSLDLTEHPRRDPMTLSRDSGLTLSDCQLFLPESPVGSEDSAVNAPSSAFDKSLAKEEKSNNKTYTRVYAGWEERMSSYASGSHHSSSVEHNFREEKTAGGGGGACPNPNFQRQDWLRAQLKRTPRTKLDEHEHRKERYDDKDLYGQEYLRQDSMKENVENCKDLYRSPQQQDIRGGGAKRCPIHNSKQDLSGDASPLCSVPHYEFKKKERFGEFKKKIKSEDKYTSTGDLSVPQNGNYRSSSSEFYKKPKSELYAKEPATRCGTAGERYNESDDNNTYATINRDRTGDLYGSSERIDTWPFVMAEPIDLSLYEPSEDEEEEEERTWPETPPPLPPRLRHLPPVHMNLEDRHKVAGRSRSLPPPPPYRPPPQPRAPITTRHLGHGRSVVDDESYV